MEEDEEAPQEDEKLEKSDKGRENGVNGTSSQNHPENNTAEEDRMETRQSSNCEESGTKRTKEKDRSVDMFWKHIWPKLEEAGWTKHDRAGGQSGCVTFPPKGSTMDAPVGVSSGESYDRIRDVLDRLGEGRSQTEAAIANLYHRLQQDVEWEKTTAINIQGFPPSRPSRHNVLRSPKMDLSWKEGGRIFPRKTSQIGENYQVSTLPDAGTFDPNEQSECVILWDAKEASSLLDEDGNLAILEKIPANKREGALELLAKRNYVPGEDFVECATALPARNGSDWPAEKKAKFSELVFSLRKDLQGVRAAMGIDMATCLAHYYGVFKHTDNYRLVKTVLHDEKMDAKTAAAVATINGAAATASSPGAAPAAVQEVEPDVCLICGDGGELLICDGCEGEYHMECMDPPLQSIPEGHWECDECVNQKLLEFRDYLVRQSGLFEAKDEETDGGGPSVIYKPTQYAMDAIRTMALGISEKLATPAGDEYMEVESSLEAAVSVKSEDTPSSGGGRRKRKRKSGAVLLC